MSDNEQPEVIQEKDAPKVPRVQYVFVTLADGRQGAFAGPELITKAELLLKPPTLVDIVFSEPRDMDQPAQAQEVLSANTETENKSTGTVGA